MIAEGIRGFENCIRHYADFDGRATRTEFWGFVIVHFVIELLISMFGLLFGPLGRIVMLVYSLGTLVPFWAVSWRRIHDIGRSGAWNLLVFTGIGFILLFVWWVSPGQTGSNQYGPDPFGSYGAPYSPPRRTGGTGYAAPMQLAGIAGVYSGRRYQIGNDEILIGRDSKARVRYSDKETGVSRSHCKVYIQDGRLMLMDMGSSNGTFLSGYGKIPPMHPVEIKRGSRFYIGSKRNGFKIQ